MKLIQDVDVTLAQISRDLVFVFVGEEYAGSAEKGALGVWEDHPVLADPRASQPHGSMWSAVGSVVHQHADLSLRSVLFV